SIAQLHGDEDEKYITQLKKKCDLCQRWKDKYGKPLSLKVIKTLKSSRVFTAKESEPEQVKTNIRNASQEDLRFSSLSKVVDYFLIDSDSGSGKPFDWQLLSKLKLSKPWFLAGGVNIENIEQAMVCKPFAVDVSSGVETDGIKNREKIIRLTTAVKKGYVR
ncbi:MAG: phosphoribosylanthranilate isomerase, partial [Treponema sp.]|nr:phosphoribosylanthranilate isomerase [Treponema sp.]